MLVTYPSDPEAWSETLHPEEGDWSPVAGEVEFDPYVKVAGEGSIRTYAVGYIYYEGSIFTLKNGKEFDGTQTNAKLFFYHALDEAHNGNVTVVLYDVDGRSAARQTITSPTSVWETKEYRLGPGQGWDEEAGFDWTKIKQFRIDCWENSGQAGSFWVETLHFSYEVAEGVLVVASNPAGKTGSMTYLEQIYPFTTPSQTPSLPVGTTVTVSIDATDFQNWLDGNTSPTRTETIEPGTKTITAIYGVAEPALLTIKSFDENLNNFPGEKAVKIVYAGIEQYLDVPFSAKLTKGTYALIAEAPGDRTFAYWVKPDGSTTTDLNITFDLQTDTEVEVHWVSKGGGFPWQIILATGVALTSVALIVIYLKKR